MKNIYLLNLFFFFFFFSFAHAEKIVERYEYQGQIKKLINHKTNILLPQGRWIASGIEKNTTGNRWMGIAFSLFENDKLVAIIDIWAPRELASTGWDPGEDIICDDYENQGSNYFYISNKNYSKGWIKKPMACHNIWVLNKVDSAYCQNCEEIQETWDYMIRNNIEFPDALIEIGFSFLEKENWVEIYMSINPEFAGIASENDIWWQQSEWHKSRIFNYSDKNEYMTKVISLTSQLRETLYEEFKKGRKGTMNFDDFKNFRKMLPLSEILN